MKRASLILCCAGATLIGPGVIVETARGYPPAPPHRLYGTVRDEYGHPLTGPHAEVVLTTLNGTTLKTGVAMAREPGINYWLEIPMDAGLTAEPYRPTALRPWVPFRVEVRIGNRSYVPLQTRADYLQLGLPARTTRLDLTLGEDTDGDGLPDAWERWLLTMLGWPDDLSLIGPEGDADGDGLTNLQEYLAGTYAFDPEDGFVLQIERGPLGPELRFLGIRDRTYLLEASNDLRQWFPVSFRLGAETPQMPPRTSYRASDSRILTLRPVTGTEPAQFYRLLVR